jgi:cell division protein FtsW
MSMPLQRRQNTTNIDPSARGHHPDYLLGIGVFTLLIIGMVLMYSISPVLTLLLDPKHGTNSFFIKQFGFLLLGLLAWAVIVRISYDRWRRNSIWVMLLALALSFLLFTPLGVTSLGATRWLRLGPVQVQPAEILKFSWVIFLAAWLNKRSLEDENPKITTSIFTVMIIVICFIIAFLQKDLGTMLVVLVSSLAMFYTSGISWKYFIVVLAILGIGVFITVFAFPHRVARLTTFTSSNCSQSSTSLGSNYQVCQGLIAVGSGGLAGVGLGHSIQIYGYLPEAQNDSIYAIIGEEFGVIGSLLIIGLFGFIAYRGLIIASDAPDLFSRLVATGISLWLFTQALINIASTIALMPFAGVPLPFISYGGTSLVLSLAGIGVLMQISRLTVKEASNEGSRERRGNSRPYIANTRNGRSVKVAR